MSDNKHQGANLNNIIIIINNKYNNNIQGLQIY